MDADAESYFTNAFEFKPCHLNMCITSVENSPLETATRSKTKRTYTKWIFFTQILVTELPVFIVE